MKPQICPRCLKEQTQPFHTCVEKSDTPRTDAFRKLTPKDCSSHELTERLLNSHDQLERELNEAKRDKERLDWLEKQKLPTAIWQGTFSDNQHNISLGRVGAPIVTISTMEPDGRVSNDDEIGSGDTIRTAIDAAIKEKHYDH